MAGLEQDLLAFIKNFLTTVGYPGVFILMMIEGFGIPIPSELTMPFSGFLASDAGGNKFSVIPAIVVGAAGEVTGGVIAYWLGYFGGRPALERYGRFVLLSTDELERGETWFGRYGDWIVLGTRLLPAIRSFIALPAGVVRMPFWRFLIYGAIGSTIWCTALVLIGHALGQNWNNVSNALRKYDVIVIVALVLLIGFALYKRLTAGRKTPGEAVSTEL
jgi:membrane protein DedA with SNARE-associated domain